MRASFPLVVPNQLLIPVVLSRTCERRFFLSLSSERQRICAARPPSPRGPALPPPPPPPALPRVCHSLGPPGIKVGEDFSTEGLYALLGALTGRARPLDEARGLLGGSYVLTSDNLLKILAILTRVRCRIPVVLMGECGCGKTHLVSFLCAWLEAPVAVLDVHGGTTEADVIAVFEEAEAKLEAARQRGGAGVPLTGGGGGKRGGKSQGDGSKGSDGSRVEGEPEVFVFLDEVNACGHMGLINEAISHRSLNGRTLSPGIKVLAALNPYRLRADLGAGAGPGLTFRAAGAAAVAAAGAAGAGGGPDPMRALVYRVHPVPRTLQDFIFDFGALTAARERAYVLRMAAGQLAGAVRARKSTRTHLCPARFV